MHGIHAYLHTLYDMMNFPSHITDIEVQFDSTRYIVIEDSGEVELTIKTDKAFEYPFTVPVVTVDGNARCMYICVYIQLFAELNYLPFC